MAVSDSIRKLISRSRPACDSSSPSPPSWSLTFECFIPLPTSKHISTWYVSPFFPLRFSLANIRWILDHIIDMENAPTSEGKDPSVFLSEIIGAPVIVKLNSGVVYKGMGYSFNF